MTKNMTKKKKRMPKYLKILLLVFLVIVLLCSYCMMAPFGRHRASNKEVLKTEIAVPQPDEIAYIKGGIAFTLSAEKQEQIYSLFSSTLQGIGTDSYATFIGKVRLVKYVMLNTNIEFRYEQCQKRIGKRIEYDAVLLSFDDRRGELVPVFSLNGVYYVDFTYRRFKLSDEHYAQLKQGVKDIVF